MKKRNILLLTATLFSAILLMSCSSGIENQYLGQCLTDKSIKMYGAYWCPHCQEQKQLFGKGWENVTYVECSLPGGKGQTEYCTQQGIESYPTWEFADGTRINGKLSLEELSRISECALRNN